MLDSKPRRDAIPCLREHMSPMHHRSNSGVQCTLTRQLGSRHKRAAVSSKDRRKSLHCQRGKQNTSKVLRTLSVFMLIVLAISTCDNGDSTAGPRPVNLEDAVEWGTVEEVSTFVAHGADVNGRDDAGNPILLAAVARRVPTFGISIMGGQPVRYDPEPLKILIEAGAGVNARDSSGNPMLHTAIKVDVEAVRILAEAGADVNAIDSEGDPVIKEAIWRGEAEVVKVLVEAGADVNAKDADGDPILKEAIWRDEVEVVKVLIEEGANVNQRDSKGESMLREARFRENSEVEKVLLEAGAVLSESEQKECESQEFDSEFWRKVTQDEDIIRRMAGEWLCLPD